LYRGPSAASTPQTTQFLIPGSIRAYISPSPPRLWKKSRRPFPRAARRLTPPVRFPRAPLTGGKPPLFSQMAAPSSLAPGAVRPQFLVAPCRQYSSRHLLCKASMQAGPVPVAHGWRPRLAHVPGRLYITKARSRACLARRLPRRLRPSIPFCLNARASNPFPGLWAHVGVWHSPVLPTEG